MSRKSIGCSVLLVLISWASFAVPASAQHFKQVTGNLAHVSAGRNEVFGIDSSSGVWRVNATKTSFTQIPGAQLLQIAVGGGMGAELDDIWGVDVHQSIYRFDYHTNNFVQSNGLLVQIKVGEGVQNKCHPYETWGINSSQEVFRYNYCTNQFLQIAHASLADVETGGGDVWGISSSGDVFHFDFATLAFVQVPGVTGTVQVAVGVNDTWAINSSSQIFRYDPSSGGFVQVGGALVQIAAGGNGVWGVSQFDQIFRFDPATGGFVQVNGLLTGIAVGYGSGVFGVNSSDEVFTFVRP